MRPRKAVLLVLLTSLGCQEVDPHIALAARDSAGVVVLEIDTASHQESDPLHLVPVAFSLDLPEFGEIVDVGLADDERLVVLDRLGPDVAVLDTSGAALARFGRAGSGPGEFSAPGLTEIVVLGDTIAVPDVVNQRVSFFDFEGNLLTTISVSMEDGLAVDWRAHPEGGLVFRVMAGGPVRLMRLKVPGQELFELPGLTDFTVPPASAPLAPLPLWCILPTGQSVWARTDRYEVFVNNDRRVETLVRSNAGQRLLGRGDLEHLEQMMGESIRRRAGPNFRPELLSQLLESVVFPEHAPLIASLSCSDVGSIWVQNAQSVGSMGPAVMRVGSTEGIGSGSWDIVDFEAGRISRIVLPTGSRITRVTPSMVLGVATDDLGVETVARWRR